MNVARYLERINVEQVEALDYSSVAKLQRQHLLTVPFENLDIVRGETIVLDLSRIYTKIVRRLRGGFCYELNGLFGWLLGELGFSVSLVSARVYLPERGAFTPEFDHMGLLVHLEQTYLVDVGFGDSFRTPIPMPHGEVEDISGRYRTSSLPPDCERCLLQKLDTQGWVPLYRFAVHPRIISEFADMCLFHQTSPESPFTRGPFCTVATESGRLTLSANHLTVTEGKERRKMPVVSPQTYGRMLREHFGIELIRK